MGQSGTRRWGGPLETAIREIRGFWGERTRFRRLVCQGPRLSRSMRAPGKALVSSRARAQARAHCRRRRRVLRCRSCRMGLGSGGRRVLVVPRVRCSKTRDGFVLGPAGGRGVLRRVPKG